MGEETEEGSDIITCEMKIQYRLICGKALL